MRDFRGSIIKDLKVAPKCGGGDGGIGGSGFFLVCEDFGRMFDHSFPACAFFFFFKADINSRKLVPLFMPGCPQ